MNFKKKEIKIQAPRLVIYGETGLGKSTWASYAKNPFFLDIEKNIPHLEGFGCEEIDSYEQLVKILYEIRNSNFPYNTIVIDSLTFLEKIIKKHACDKLRVHDISQAAHGKGYEFIRKCFNDVLDTLYQINVQKNIMIIYTGHPTKDSFVSTSHNGDKINLSLDKEMRRVLFANSNCIFYFSEDFYEKDKKGRGVIFTQPTDIFVAKSIFNLPFKMPVSIDDKIEEGYQFFRQKLEEYFSSYKVSKEEIISSENEIDKKQ